MEVYSLYIEDVPGDLMHVLTQEFEIYQVTQLYGCTRGAAIRELGLKGQVFDPDPWAVRLHREYSLMFQRIRNKK